MHTAVEKEPFDPKKFIDREFEQELFENLLTFADDARILAIQDQSGMGKSRLLEMFRYRCRTNRPRIPVSLLNLKQINDHAPIVLIKNIVEDFSTFDVPFPNFKETDNARRSGDFEYIRATFTWDESIPTANPPRPTGDSFSRYEHGLAVLRTRIPKEHPRHTEILTFEQRLCENIADARQFGNTTEHESRRAEIIMQLNTFAITEIGTPFNDICGLTSRDQPLNDPRIWARQPAPAMPMPGELTAEQQETAAEACINAFTKDIRALNGARPLVMLIDTYEACSETLAQWMHNYFLEHYFFDCERRPTRMLLVVAGQQVPQFASHWSRRECESIVRSVHKMGTWNRAHVEECLRVHGFTYTANDVDLFYGMIERGWSPSEMVSFIERQKR